MKVKAAKEQKKPASKLVEIKKTKVDIQKPEKPKKNELKKSTAMKAVVSSVPAPLTFAEKKVLSVKRKAKAAKGVPETTSATVKAKFSKVAKTGSVSKPKEEPVAAGSPGKQQQKQNKKNAQKTSDGGVKKANKNQQPAGSKKPDEIKDKTVDDLKQNPGASKEQTSKGKQNKTNAKASKGKVAPSGAVSSEQIRKKAKVQSVKVSEAKKGTDTQKKKRKLGKKAFSAAPKPTKPREVGPVATEVTEATLALLPEQLISAASFRTLFEHVKKKANEAEQNRLFGEDLKYSLEIGAWKIPAVPSRVARVALPHTTVLAEDEVCLIVNDLQRGRKVDHADTKHHWEDKLRELGFTRDIVVLPFQQLKRDYGTFDMKLKLVRRFTRFLVDARICGHVFAKLGKVFIKRAKNPIAVKLEDDASIKSNFEKAINRESYRISNTSLQTNIKFAANWMPVEHAVENGMALIEALKTIHPGGWLNIKSLYLMASTTVSQSFVLYLSDMDPNAVPVPKTVGPRDHFISKQNAKLAKLTDGKFRVTRDGLLRAGNSNQLPHLKGSRTKGELAENANQKLEEEPEEDLEEDDVDEDGDMDEDSDQEEDA